MSNLNLMAAMGDRVIDINDPRMTLIPESRGNYHAPFPHATLLDMVFAEMNKLGLEAVNTAHAVTTNGNRYFGILEMAAETDYFSSLMAIRATHDQKFPITVSWGSGVWVCSNLCIGGSEVSATKHTTNVMDRLPEFIAKALIGIAERNSSQDAIFKRYMQASITEKTAMASITYMLERGIISSNEILRVIKEWREPSHLEFTEDGYSVWRLFNSVTEAYKPRTEAGNAMVALHDRSPKLMSFMNTLARDHSF